MNNNSIVVSAVATLILLIGVAIGIYSATSLRTDASVTVGNEYQATSTAANVAYGATITDDKTLKTSYGALGSVIITGANTGIVNFYDATTSDMTKRGNKATSTLLIASLPASLAAGTYVFDAWFVNGLLVDLDSGTMPTTTITYR